MKIWVVTVLAALSASLLGQGRLPLTPDERAIAEKAFRAYTKSASSLKVDVRRINGREAEVTGPHDVCEVDLVTADVSRWETRDLPADPNVIALDRPAALAKAKEYAAAHKIDLGAKFTDQQSAGIWRFRFTKTLNGFETPLADTLDVDRNGKVRSIDRDLLLFRPRTVKMVVQEKDAVDIARSLFVDKYGDVESVKCTRTAYEFVGSSEFNSRTVNENAPRRLRLAHTVEITGSSHSATIVIDIVDGEVVRDDVRPHIGVPRTGGITKSSPDPESHSGAITLLTVGIMILVVAGFYYFSTLERIKQTREAEEELV